jgi:hypothetical protein
VPINSAVWDFLLVEILIRRRNLSQKQSNLGFYLIYTMHIINLWVYVCVYVLYYIDFFHDDS